MRGQDHQLTLLGVRPGLLKAPPLFLEYMLCPTIPIVGTVFKDSLERVKCCGVCVPEPS